VKRVCLYLVCLATVESCADDTSLLGTFGNGVNNNLVDASSRTAGGDLKINRDPARGQAFNMDRFSFPVLGQFGNAPCRSFYGPGIQNVDLVACTV
jgi:hypothetical protein